MMAERLELRFGAPVVHGDTRLGTLAGIVLRPDALTWEALLVRRGRVRRTEVTVLRGAIASADDEQVVLAAPPVPGTAAPTGPVLHARTRVSGRGGVVLGRPAVVLAGADGAVSGIVLRSGLFAARRIVPAEHILQVTPDGIITDLDRDAVRALGRYRPDAELNAAVQAALASYKPVALYEGPHLRVTVTDGVVTLEGHVSSRLRAEHIEAAVATVPGVQAVDNRLICDDELEVQVAQALGADPRTRARPIAVHARHGVVTLSGRVPEATVAEAATTVAAALPAVRAVVNRIEAPGFVPDEAPLIEPLPGQEVYADDGPVGVVHRVAIDPRTRRVSGIVVRTGRAAALPRPEQQGPEAVYIPARQIRTVTETAVLLQGERAALTATPAAGAVVSAPDGWQPPFPYRLHEVVWPVEAARVPERAPADAARVAA
jgi:osmotically-inducible protein OsmY/sporulation protein YlmC with PRC-barrel domain